MVVFFSRSYDRTTGDRGVRSIWSDDVRRRPDSRSYFAAGILAPLNDFAARSILLVFIYCTHSHATSRVNAINVGWTLTDNEHKIQREEMGSEDWIEEADKVFR